MRKCLMLLDRFVSLALQPFLLSHMPEEVVTNPPPLSCSDGRATRPARPELDRILQARVGVQDPGFRMVVLRLHPLVAENVHRLLLPAIIVGSHLSATLFRPWPRADEFPATSNSGNTTIKKSRLLINISFYMLGATYLAVALSILLSCQPFHKFWQINPNPGSESSASTDSSWSPVTTEQILISHQPTDVCQPTISSVYVLVIVILNVLSDAYLISIPLPVRDPTKVDTYPAAKTHG